jgi:anaerobic magnesium-protoporphyrin IX monomethyl ester cyclase
MKLFLIVPRCYNPKRTYREYPIGVGMVATALRRAGYETIIFDQEAEEATDDLLFDVLDKLAPDAVGFSIITPNYPVARLQIDRLKKKHPDLPILVGGIHATLFPSDLLDDGADCVVMGRGEETAVVLADCISRKQSLDGIQGIAYRDSDGKHIISSLCRISQPNRISGIDRDTFNLPLYDHHSIMASLGCPYHCTFCCNYSGTILQNGIAFRAPEEVFKEMQYLYENYAARKVFFADDVFFLQRQRIMQFCRLTEKAKWDMQWIAQLRVDSVDDETSAAMVQGGCHRVYFGVESGSDAIYIEYARDLIPIEFDPEFNMQKMRACG